MSEKIEDYSWVTDEMFDEALCYLLDGISAESIMSTIPGVYELVKEEYNNDVLAKLEEWRNEE